MYGFIILGIFTIFIIASYFYYFAKRPDYYVSYDEYEQFEKEQQKEIKKGLAKLGAQRSKQRN